MDITNEENAGVAGTATPAAGDSAKPAKSTKPKATATKPAAAKSAKSTAAKPAAAKVSEAKPAETPKPATDTPNQGDGGQNGETQSTPSAPEKPLAKGKLSPAAQIAKAHGVSEVYENEAGEYFTSQNLAMLSVNQDATKLKKHNC